MKRSEYTEGLSRLRRSLEKTIDNNPLSYECRGCSGCVSCQFSVDCQDCYRSTHCQRCRGLSGCSHCQDCVSCHDCSHCLRSQGCRGSAYLTDCVACSDCTYCYGCVGLSRKEFHILNVPYDRKTYFAMVKALGG